MQRGDIELALFFALPSGAVGFGLDAAEIHVGGEVEGGAVVAPGAVGGAFAGGDTAEQFALGGEDINASRAGGPEVAFFIYFEAIGQAG